MPIKILMPTLSPTMTTGNLAKWLKQKGDQVLPGEVIAEIETDKATMEIEAVDAGIIGAIVVPAGTTEVAVNSLIAILLEEGEDETVLQQFCKQGLVDVDSVIETTQQPIVSLTKNVCSLSEQNVEQQYTSLVTRIAASPLARRIALQQNIDLTTIKGSGPHGRIVKDDVLNAKHTTTQCMRVSLTTDRIVPNNNIRQIIAARLLESKTTIPHFYLTIECNVDALIAAREEINNCVAGDDKDKRISINDFVVLAVARSLQQIPEANASWEHKNIRYYADVNISVAVAIDNGLITPVLRNADKKSIFELSAQIKQLVKKARNNKLTPEEFQGGSFTISNLGMYGIKNFSAIINPPQSCILAVGTNQKRPVVMNNTVQVATIMELTLSCDHRVVDGVVGARFLTKFKQFIEQPILMFI